MRIHIVRSSGPSFSTFLVQNLTPDGFNGALLPWKDGFLLVYRDGQDELTLRTCLLDAGYNRVSEINRLSIHLNIDGRLTLWNGRPFITTHYCVDGRIECWPLKIADQAEIDNEFLIGKKRLCFMGVENWPGYTRCCEKNWAPFIHNGMMHYVHSMNPHRILRVNDLTSEVELIHEEPFKEIAWAIRDVSELRLNTNPVLMEDGTYLSTFHRKTYPGGDYYFGFYRFEGTPPWRVISMSPSPVFYPADGIGGPSRYDSRDVFLLSMQIELDLIRLCGGSNDRAVAIHHLSLKEIIGSLVKV